MKTKFYDSIIILLMISAIFVCVAMATTIYNTPGTDNTDLEIYTTDNIYFIHGLTVTNDMDRTVLNFESRADLKEYISTVTADDVNQVLKHTLTLVDYETD